MPNHFTTVLTVTGPEAALKEFVNRLPPRPVEGSEVESPIFSCEEFLPMPPELEDSFEPKGEVGKHAPFGGPEGHVSIQSNHPEAIERRKRNVEKYGAPYWYDWRVNVWGTKWDTYSHGQTTVTPNEFETSFETAWSPPMGALVAASTQHPNLRFEIAGWDEFEEEDYEPHTVLVAGEKV